jgi:uncharacterized RDD family membrane protein YckC
MTPPFSPASPSRRVGAGVIDFFILAMFARTVGSFGASSRMAAAAAVALLTFAPLLYQILLHAKFGQTIGKYLLGISVRRTDFSPIGFREALLRSSVDGVFSLHWLAVLAIAMHSLPESAFANRGWSNLYASLEPSLPPHFQAVSVLGAIWVWSEFVTMLFSEQRRAVHDFIARTVVLYATRAA